MGFVKSVFRAWKRVESVAAHTYVISNGKDLRSHSKNIEKMVVQYLSNCISTIPFDEKAVEDRDILIASDAIQELKSVEAHVESIRAAMVAAIINMHIKQNAKNESVPDDPEASYANKRRLIATINETLTEKYDMTIEWEGAPCIIYAIVSRDGYGRYTFENKLTKKRSGYFDSLLPLLPLKVTQNPPRKNAKKEKTSAEPDADPV